MNTTIKVDGIIRDMLWNPIHVSEINTEKYFIHRHKYKDLHLP